jgi:hypothetical protein
VPVLAIAGARNVLLDSAETRSRLEHHALRAEVVHLPEADTSFPIKPGKSRHF